MAIKESELRLENLINYNGEPMPIFSIDRGCRSFYTINDIQINRNTGCTIKGGEDVFNPIPLTEKWLLSLGFIDPSGGYRATGAEVVYEITAKEKKIELWMRWPDAWGFSNWNKCEIKYVHQLQNLYFSLVGEELQIKEV